MSTNSCTRRDFLKKVGYGAIGAAALVMTPSCSRKPDYKSTRELVEDETGSYEVIRNPAEPLYGERGSAAIDFEIGDPGGLATDPDGNYIIPEGVDENYIFAGIRDVSFNDGKIYIADKLEHNIRVFDAYGGAHQATFSRKGQGPGEISSWVDHMYIDSDGFVYACERNGSLHIFNNDYEFLRKHNVKSLAEGVTEIYDIASFDPENFLLHCSFRLPFSSTTTASDNKNEDLFVRLNKDGEWFSFGPNRGFPGFEEGVQSLKRTTKPLGSMNYNIYYSMLLSHKNMFLDQEKDLLYSSTKTFPSRVVVRSSDDGNILRIIERGVAENEPLCIIREVNMDSREASINTPDKPFRSKFDKGKITEQYYFTKEGIGIFADNANIYNVYKRRSKDGDNLRVQHFMDVFGLKGTYKQRVPLDIEMGSNFAGMDNEGNMVVFRNLPWPAVVKYQLGGIEK